MKDCFRNSCDFFVCVLIYSVVWSCLVGFHIITISLQEGERLSLLYKVALNGWRLSPQTIHGPEGSKCPIISCNKILTVFLINTQSYLAPKQFCTRPTAVPIRGSNVHKSIANFMAMIGERHGAAMCRTTPVLEECVWRRVASEQPGAWEESRCSGGHYAFMTWRFIAQRPPPRLAMLQNKGMYIIWI